MSLALASGIAPAVWLAEPDDIILTAIDILNKQSERRRRR